MAEERIYFVGSKEEVKNKFFTSEAEVMVNTDLKPGQEVRVLQTRKDHGSSQGFQKHKHCFTLDKKEVKPCDEHRFHGVHRRDHYGHHSAQAIREPHDIARSN